MLLSAELSNLFVVCLGLGVVFVGLISLILICQVMGTICTSFIRVKRPEVQAPAPALAPKAPAPAPEIKNRQEFVAAIAAAIAEDLGTDVSRIRIHSIKKL